MWDLCEFNAEGKVPLLIWDIKLCKIKADRYKNGRLMEIITAALSRKQQNQKKM